MTDAELAVLSLVGEQARHGYEIEQVIEARGMRDWTEVGFSSIYYLLKKLEREGLIDSRLEETERGPARKVYHITPAGREARHTALIQALAEPIPQRSRLMLGVSNLPAIPTEEATAALGQYHDTLVARLQDVQTTRESQRPLPYFVDAMFDYSVTMIQAECAWIQRLIAQVRSEELTKGGSNYDQDRLSEGIEAPV